MCEIDSVPDYLNPGELTGIGSGRLKHISPGADDFERVFFILGQIDMNRQIGIQRSVLISDHRIQMEALTSGSGYLVSLTGLIIITNV